MKNTKTFYNGIYYNTRLEARWAIFLDNFGVSYKVNEKVFKLKDGTLFKPTFYLTHYDFYAKVVEYHRHNHTDFNNSFELFLEQSKHTILLDGIPDYKSYTCIAFVNGYPGDQNVLFSEEYRNERFYYAPDNEEIYTKEEHLKPMYGNWVDKDWLGSDYEKAVIAAKSERFDKLRLDMKT